MRLIGVNLIVKRSMISGFLLGFDRNSNGRSGFNYLVAGAIIKHAHSKAEKVKCG